MPPPHRLVKSLWTEADFDVMGWHDATLHAIALPIDTFELALDIDYILEWIPPGPGETPFRFRLAPATLVFWNVHDLHIDLSPQDDLTIADIERSDPTRPPNAEHVGREVEWRWTIACHVGAISFRSCGFRQHLRAPPVLGSQSLSLEERGGISFDRPGEWILT